MDTIHVSHAIGRKGGEHYRARACVASLMDGRLVRHGFTVSIDDTPEEAEQNAVRYVREMYTRDGLEPPESVISHGRKPGAIVDGFLFIPAA